jgi:hypothetical protein
MFAPCLFHYSHLFFPKACTFEVLRPAGFEPALNRLLNPPLPEIDVDNVMN